MAAGGRWRWRFRSRRPPPTSWCRSGAAGDNRYYGKFCRNLVYWLTENSAIGRRRLVATADKRFYRPGETITVQAATYDESAAPTQQLPRRRRWSSRTARAGRSRLR